MWSDPLFRFEQHETNPRATPDCKSCGTASERPLDKDHYISAERLAARQLPDASRSACATESIATVGLPTVNYCYRGDPNQTRTFC